MTFKAFDQLCKQNTKDRIKLNIAPLCHQQRLCSIAEARLLRDALPSLTSRGMRALTA